ncbi:hypothetical protein B0H11DRAFT_2269111 [Mycena galericulata]|nr:hypothetical protein B0H11DRAFT_2269111 [Mycena galericulata]
MASSAPNLIPLPSTPANEWAFGTNEILNAHVTRTPLLTPDPVLPGVYPDKKPSLSMYSDTSDAILDAARAALTEITGYFATARTHSATAEDLDIPTRLARPIPPVFVRAYSDFGARPSHAATTAFALAPKLRHHLAPRPPLSATSSFSATSGMYSDFSSPAFASTPTPPLLSPELELESPETAHPARAAYGYFAPSRTHPARPPVLVRAASSPSPSFFNASSTSLAAPTRPPLSTTSSFSATSGMYSSDSDVEFSRRASPSPSLHSPPAPDETVNVNAYFNAPSPAPRTEEQEQFIVSPETRARLREEGGVPLVREAGLRGVAPSSISLVDAESGGGDADADMDTATTDPANEYEQQEDERAEDGGQNQNHNQNHTRRARFVARIKERMHAA